MLLPERLEGAVYGHLVGDALGVPYEFQPPERIGQVAWRGHGTHDQPPGTWSDDGALMLALLDSLLSSDGFDTADQARRALRWRDEGALRPGRAGLRHRERHLGRRCAHCATGCPAEEAGAVDALGNGSLMRILGLPLVCRGVADDELVELAARASRVTHGSAEAQVACALYALIVRRLLAGETDRHAVLATARQALRAALAGVGLPGSQDASAPDGGPQRARRLRGLDRTVGQRPCRGQLLVGLGCLRGSGRLSPLLSRRPWRTATTRTRRPPSPAGWPAPTGASTASPTAWQRGLRDRAIVQELVDRLVETDQSEWDGAPWRTSRKSPLRVDLWTSRGPTLAIAAAPRA